MEAAFRISTTHEVAPVLVPSFHTFLHLRLAISSVSSLADHLLFHPSRRIRFVSTSLSCPIVSVLFVFRLLPSFLLAIILRSLGIRELLHFVSLFESPHPRPFSLPLSVWLLHQRPSSNLLPLASSLLFRFFLSPTRRPFASRICSHFPLFRSRIAFKSRRELFTFCPRSLCSRSFRRPPPGICIVSLRHQSHFIYRAILTRSLSIVLSIRPIIRGKRIRNTFSGS